MTKSNETDMSVYLRNGSVISLRGADKPDSLRGVGLNFLVMDEAADIDEDAWYKVLRPTLSDKGGHALFVGSPRGRNWLYDLWMKGQNGEPDWASWQFTTLQGGNVPEAEIEAAKKDLDELSFRAEFLGDFVSFLGRVYEPFNYKEHCAAFEYDSSKDLIICLDFNFSPGVAVMCQEQQLPNGEFGTAVIGEVYIPRGSSTPAVCRRIIADYGEHKGRVRVYGDATGAAGGSSRVLGSDWDLAKQELSPTFRERLFFNVPAANPPERVRVNAVNSRLKSAAGNIRLMVDPVKAPRMVRDLEGVQLLEGGSGEIDKKVNPDLTHMCFAAGTMVDLDTGPCRIEDVPPQGMVRTWDGSYVPYDCAGMTLRDAMIVSLTISDGSMIYCTPWHQFLTDKGWKCARDLSGLSLKTWQSKLSLLPSRLSTEPHSICLEKSHTSTGRSTSRLPIFTERYGNGITDQFQKAITSITGTVIRPITKSLTWKCSLLKSTSITIIRQILSLGKKPGRRGLSWPVLLLLNGIDLRKVWSGTGFRGMHSGGRSEIASSLLFASSAELTSNTLALARTPLCSAPKPVRPNTAFKVGSITRTGPALNAIRFSRSISTSPKPIAPEHAQERLSVVDVREERAADVYCLHVPSTGCFALANGVIVSNSDALGYYIVREHPLHDTKMRRARARL